MMISRSSRTSYSYGDGRASSIMSSQSGRNLEILQNMHTSKSLSAPQASRERLESSTGR